MNRRTWLLGSIAMAVVSRTARADEAIDAIKAKGRAAGMDPFEVTESANFRGVGDATTRYREDALKICEAVAKDFRSHFKDKDFDVTWPDDKLTVVILAGPQSYAAFEGGFVDEAVGGHYDLDSNRLVTFDFRRKAGTKRQGVGINIPEKDNTLALVHETIHQLSYNTGLLDRKADVPDLISEGLATYGETWSPRVREGVIGATNARRLLGFKEGKAAGVDWIPIAKILSDDKQFDDEKTQQVVYAESWALVYKLMREPARSGQFRAYLKALKTQTDPARRIELATKHLGDLEKLDREVRREVDNPDKLMRIKSGR